MNPILAIAQDTLFQLLGLFLSSRSLLLTGIKELVDLFRPKWEGMGWGYELIIMESTRSSDYKFIPYRTRPEQGYLHSYYEKGSFERM